MILKILVSLIRGSDNEDFGDETEHDGLRLDPKSSLPQTPTVSILKPICYRLLLNHPKLLARND
jgi:hypothetical protein